MIWMGKTIRNGVDLDSECVCMPILKVMLKHIYTDRFNLLEDE